MKKIITSLCVMAMLSGAGVANARPMTLGDLLAGRHPVSENSHQRIMTAPVRPHGCIAYGAMGALAGHFVRSGHAFMGATVGCAYGAYKRHQYKNGMKAYDGQVKAVK